MVKDIDLSGDQLNGIGTFQLNVKSADGSKTIEKNTLLSSITMSHGNPIKIEVIPVKATPPLVSKITRSILQKKQFRSMVLDQF